MVMMALVAAGTLNSSAAYLSTAVKGASSGTLSLRGGRRTRRRERSGRGAAGNPPLGRDPTREGRTARNAAAGTGDAHSERKLGVRG